MHEADPRRELEPFQALIGEWTIEMTHPAVEDTVVRGRVGYEWLEGGRFLIQRAVNEHPGFPDSLCVIGVMEGENDHQRRRLDSRRRLATERGRPGIPRRPRVHQPAGFRGRAWCSTSR